jgi:hypothetical protein
VRISAFYGGDDAKLSCGRLFNPKLVSDRSKALDHTHWGLSLTWNGISTFGRPFRTMETSQVSLAYGNLPSLYPAPTLGMDRGVFVDLVLAQTQGRIQ